MNKLLLSAALVALIPSSAMAEGFQKTAGDFLLRGRALAVIPAEDADIQGGAKNIGSIDNSVVPELDLTYFITNNIAVEVIAAVTPHNVKGKNALAGVDVADVWLLPPTVTLQYHFDPIEQVGGISPYVGAGVNYTHFFSADAKGPFNSAKFSSSWGGALQAGVDVPLSGNWALNVDVKKIWIDTELTLDGTTKVDAEINPWVVGLGVGYKF